MSTEEDPLDNVQLRHFCVLYFVQQIRECWESSVEVGVFGAFFPDRPMPSPRTAQYFALVKTDLRTLRERNYFGPGRILQLTDAGQNYLASLPAPADEQYCVRLQDMAVKLTPRSEDLVGQRIARFY